MSDMLRKLYIEPSSSCNLKCTMCFRKSWFDETLADMSMTVFSKIMETMPQSVESIFFGGMGEPLAHENIVEMVQCAASKVKNVSLITNATLLSPKMCEQLLAAGLNNLWVSIDSFNDQHYENIRKNSILSLIERNLVAFNEHRKIVQRPVTLNLAFVVMKSNLSQLEYLPAFVVRYKISDVNISHVIPTDEDSLSEILYDRILDWGIGELRASSTQIHIPLMNWRHEGVTDVFKELFSASACNIVLSGQTIARKQRRCRFVDEGNAFVKHDGSVSPCMALLHSSKTYWGKQQRTIHHHNFGNVLAQGLSTIWQSDDYQIFRRKVRDFEFSPCFRCTPCENWEQNLADCFGNTKPTCGACLWAEGLISCP